MAESDEMADLKESMLTFEAALTSKEVAIPEASPPKAILLALDGSNQDPTAEGLAAALARRFVARLHLTYAYEGPPDEPRDRYLAERAGALEASGLQVSWSRRAEADDRSFDQILAVGQQERCGLIVVCAPYLEDLNALGLESIGSNLDMLMSRANVPMLVVREPKSDPSACFHDMLIPIAHPPEVNLAAAGWALLLAARGGTIRLLFVTDPETGGASLRRFEHEIEAKELDPDLLADLEAREHASLIAALQRRAVSAGLGCKVMARLGEPVCVITDVANAAERIIVAHCPNDRRTTTYQRVQAVVRESRNPVLIV